MRKGAWVWSAFSGHRCHARSIRAKPVPKSRGKSGFHAGHTGRLSALLATARHGAESVCGSGTPTALTCRVSRQLVLQLVRQQKLTSGVRTHFTVCSSEWGFGGGVLVCSSACSSFTRSSMTASHLSFGRPGDGWGLGKPPETLSRKWAVNTVIGGGWCGGRFAHQAPSSLDLLWAGAHVPCQSNPKPDDSDSHLKLWPFAAPSLPEAGGFTLLI